jgi:glucose/arabinose dehydrogenase
MARTTVLTPLLLLPLLAALACGSGSNGEKMPFGLASQVVAAAPRVSEIAFAPDGRIFLAEQLTGNIRIISADGQLQDEPFAHLDVATYLEQLDWGLTGLALDPQFATNHYVYAFYMEPVSSSQPPEGPTARPKIIRFTERNGKGTEETVISDDFPVTPREHPGYNGSGKIHFGPDGYLYASIGDYDYPPEESMARNISTPIGKLLRIDPKDGSAPPGSPLAGEPAADQRVFAYGFREPFPFTFHPDTGAIYGTDNTTVSCEELNVIVAGKDYGWPDVGQFPYSDCSAGGHEQAIYHLAREGKQPGDFLSFVEVSGLAFVPATQYPQMGASLLVCESQRSEVEGQRTPGVLRRLVLGGAAGREVTASDIIVRDCKGAVAVSPDGFVYYANDTEVRKLVTAGVGNAPAGVSPP